MMDDGLGLRDYGLGIRFRVRVEGLGFKV